MILRSSTFPVSFADFLLQVEYDTDACLFDCWIYNESGHRLHKVKGFTSVSDAIRGAEEWIEEPLKSA